MTLWQQLALLCVGTAISLTLNLLISMYFYRWRKRETFPEEVHKEIRALTKDLVAVRGRVLYIEGRLNGKNWLKD